MTVLPTLAKMIASQIPRRILSPVSASWAAADATARAEIQKVASPRLYWVQPCLVCGVGAEARKSGASDRSLHCLCAGWRAALDEDPGVRKRVTAMSGISDVDGLLKFVPAYKPR